MMSYAELLKNIMKSLYDPQIEASETVKKFFHQNYQQCINNC